MVLYVMPQLVRDDANSRLRKKENLPSYNGRTKSPG